METHRKRQQHKIDRADLLLAGACGGSCRTPSTPLCTDDEQRRGAPHVAPEGKSVRQKAKSACMGVETTRGRKKQPKDHIGHLECTGMCEHRVDKLMVLCAQLLLLLGILAVRRVIHVLNCTKSPTSTYSKRTQNNNKIPITLSHQRSLVQQRLCRGRQHTRLLHLAQHGRPIVTSSASHSHAHRRAITHRKRLCAG